MPKMEFTKKKKAVASGCGAKESRNLYTTIDRELLWNICKCHRLGLLAGIKSILYNA